MTRETTENPDETRETPLPLPKGKHGDLNISISIERAFSFTIQMITGSILFSAVAAIAMALHFLNYWTADVGNFPRWGRIVVLIMEFSIVAADIVAFLLF